MCVEDTVCSSRKCPGLFLPFRLVYLFENRWPTDQIMKTLDRISRNVVLSRMMVAVRPKDFTVGCDANGLHYDPTVCLEKKGWGTYDFRVDLHGDKIGVGLSITSKKSGHPVGFKPPAGMGPQTETSMVRCREFIQNKNISGC